MTKTVKCMVAAINTTIINGIVFRFSIQSENKNTIVAAQNCLIPFNIQKNISPVINRNEL